MYRASATQNVFCQNTQEPSNKFSVALEFLLLYFLVSLKVLLIYIPLAVVGGGWAAAFRVTCNWFPAIRVVAATILALPIGIMIGSGMLIFNVIVSVLTFTESLNKFLETNVDERRKEWRKLWTVGESWER